MAPTIPCNSSDSLDCRSRSKRAAAVAVWASSCLVDPGGPVWVKGHVHQLGWVPIVILRALALPRGSVGPHGLARTGPHRHLSALNHAFFRQRSSLARSSLLLLPSLSRSRRRRSVRSYNYNQPRRRAPKATIKKAMQWPVQHDQSVASSFLVSLHYFASILTVCLPPLTTTPHTPTRSSVWPPSRLLSLAALLVLFLAQADPKYMHAILIRLADPNPNPYAVLRCWCWGRSMPMRTGTTCLM